MSAADCERGFFPRARQFSDETKSARGDAADCERIFFPQQYSDVEVSRKRSQATNDVVKRAKQLLFGDSIMFSRGSVPVLHKMKLLTFEERMRTACSEFAQEMCVCERERVARSIYSVLFYLPQSPRALFLLCRLPVHRKLHVLPLRRWRFRR